MQELRNLRKLHAAQAVRIDILKAENRAFKARVTELEAENVVLRADVADLRYQLEELRTLIFKKKRAAHAILTDSEDEDDAERPPRTPRTPDSYHRPIPKDDEVTEVVYHRFPRRKNGEVRFRTYYVEDIPLDTRKTVTKHVVEERYDPVRRRWVAQDGMPPTPVVLGDNVRMLIATLVTVERLSFAQVQNLLATLFSFGVSDGEIAKILKAESVRLVPAEEALCASIRNESSQHLDESRYDVNGEIRYAWNMTGGESGDTVYRLGVSRGKGNAEALRGASIGVLVSDDYGAYRTLAEHHQLCFAHLIRKFRDLAAHDGFTDATREDIQRTYDEIKAVYTATVSACAGPDPQGARPALSDRLRVAATLTAHDPRPVARLKTTLAKNIERYFTCLLFPSVALTNNAAERALRHVVLKRKNSFGCKSDAGASAMGTLFSVLLSLHRRDPSTYFERYLTVRGV